MNLSVCLVLLAHLALVRADFFQTLFKNVIQENSYQLNVSATCSEHLQIFASSLQNVDPTNMWAWKMVDATAKLQSGVLEGNLANLGHFDECVDTSGNTTIGEITGKYCLGTLSFKSGGDLGNFVQEQMHTRTPNLDVFQGNLGRSGGTPTSGFQWAACFPNGCSGEEMEQVYTYIFEEYLNVTLVFTFPQNLCQTKEDTRPPLTSGAIVAIALFSVILTWVVLSTLYDLYLQKTKSKPAHLVLVAFSAYTNTNKLFTMTPNNPDLMPCLNGLRVISMMWVVLGHQYGNTQQGAIFNAYDTIKWFNSWHSMYIRGATVSVDTFFVLSGLLMTYGFMRAKSKGVPFNVFLYWLHRYLRLTPAFAATILLEATLTMYLGDGPLWPSMEPVSKYCEEYWWSALLYVQNYVNVSEMCVGQSWYLSVDMQLFILSPLILLPLWKWKKKGLVLLFGLILISVVVPFVIAWVYNLSSTYVNPSRVIAEGNNDYSTKYYLVTHTRATPWLIGVLLGYIIFKTKKRNSAFKLNKLLVLLLWVATLAVLVTCVFGGHDTLATDEYQKWPNVSYVVFVRPAWAIALAWLIFACVTGNGGCINWFLSFPVYQVLARLTYSVYLLHMIVMSVRTASTRLPDYFSDYDRMYVFWGSTMFTCALSVIWVLAFESPMITIEKVLFGGTGKPQQAKPTEETIVDKC